MLADRIAVAPLEDPEKIGSIIIPDIAKQRIDQGIIIYKGPEVRELKIGMHVLFSGYAGTKISVFGEGIIIIMPEDAVAAVVWESEDWVFTGRTLERIMDELIREASGEEGVEGWMLPSELKETISTRLRDHFFAEGLMF